VSVARVAVLLAAYNGSRWIDEQIDTILLQRDVAVDLFISVDASEDDTLERCHRRAFLDCRVHVLPGSGGRGSAAANFFHLMDAVPFEGYDLIALSDQDDIWLPHKLHRAHAQLQATGCEAYSSNVTAFWPGGRKLLLDKAQPQVRYDHFFEAAGPGCTYVFTHSLAAYIKSRIREQKDALHDVALHDWYLYATVRASGHAWHIDSMPTLNYRQHVNNAVGANVGLRQFLNRYRLVRDGWWYTQIRLIAELAGCPPVLGDQLHKGRRGLVWLSRHAYQCRRRPRDQCYFAILCLAQAVAGRVRK